MKKIFFDEKKYKKLIVIFSVIVLILSMHTFTFDAYTASNCTGEICALENDTVIKNTGKFIEMNLYDYNYKINTIHHNGNNNANNKFKYPGFDQDYGTGEFAFGNVITDDINADVAVLSQGINASNPEAENKLFLPVRNQMYNKLLNGYPALKGQLSLEYLFPQADNTYVDKKNTANINHLFQYDENTGSYFYSSRNNHAEYVNGDFVVYDKIITPNYIMYPFGNFLPFDKINEETTKASLIDSSRIQQMYVDAYSKLSSNLTQYQLLMNKLLGFYSALGGNFTAQKAVETFFDYATTPSVGVLDLSNTTRNNFYNGLSNLYSIDFDKSTNFFFGFDMEMKFMQPKNGLTGKNNDKDMVFHFEGDDDVWVYIDDVLFLDLSGIHAQVGGEIDFKNGEVRYYGFDKTTYGVSTSEITKYTTKFEDISGIDKSKLIDNGDGTYGTFKDYSEHKLNFYYMERGAASGVMSLKFNMPLKPLIEENEIKISKKLASSDSGAIGDNKYYFQIAKPNNTDTITDDELFVKAPFKYDLYDSSDNKIDTITTESGIITLEASQYAIVSGLSEELGEYYVRELIDKDTSSVKVNGVNKLSNNSPKLEINGKEYILVASDIKDIFDGDGDFIFENYINLGSLKIEKKLGNNTSDKLKDEFFKVNVKINGKNLKTGTSYVVTGENNPKSVKDGGIIELKPGQIATIDKIIFGSEFEVTEVLSSNSGLINNYEVKGANNNKINGEVSIIITNTEKPGTYIEIPIYKTTTNPDGIKYTYNFKLYDVDSKEAKSISIKVNERGIGEGKFRIDYSQIDNKDEENEYNYQIYEEKVDSDKTTIYDKSIYDVKVIVKNDSDGFIASYTVSKNNKKVENDNIVFNNIKTFELPKTGSSGMLVITFAGIIFISISFISLFQKKKIGVN